MKTHLLFVDDDTELLALTERYFIAKGYAVYTAYHAEEALAVLESEPVELTVVDVMMPGMDGFELCRNIRSDYDLPILLLTARAELSDKEKGFLAGTDDYLTKPFAYEELQFRISALLRRYQKVHEQVLTAGRVTVDQRKHEVRAGNKKMLLPMKEFDLLFLLASYPEKTFSRDDLITKLWGYDFEGDERTVDVHIKRLRSRFRSIETGFTIHTVRGVGYRLEILE